jgi:hypothetical protein
MEVSTTKIIVIALAAGLVATSLAVPYIESAFANHKLGHQSPPGCVNNPVDCHTGGEEDPDQGEPDVDPGEEIDVD